MTIADLIKKDVNAVTEKKSDLTYLPWAYAWTEALTADENATFSVQMFGDKCYMEVNGTAMVWVTVTLFSKPMTCMLPVMNNKNEPISIAGRTFKDKWGNDKKEVIDSFNVNTAIMRCMTKALALHGLGLYIYSGSDYPPENDLSPVAESLSPQQIKEINVLAKQCGITSNTLYSWLSDQAGVLVSKVAECPAALYQPICEFLLSYKKGN